MKKTLLMSFFFILIFSCNKEDEDYKSTGSITGVDGTMCGCCGGWIINIDDSRYLFDTMPDDSNINFTTDTFPITVKLDWQMVNNSCSAANRITVQRIKKI